MRAFLLVLAILVASPPGVAVAARSEAGLTWRPCPEDATAQCATLSVPVDWAAEDWAAAYGPRTGVALARRPATGPGERIGTLVVNPGGPGASGVDFALEAAGFFSDALRARFDIVGFDPRGVGRSNPVTCDPGLVRRAPSPLINTAAGYAARVTYNRRLAADCRTRTGPVFDHLDSLSTARDVDALRAALGESRLTFYGASYGTVIGAAYADLFPSRVRAIALDSVLDHNAGTADFLALSTAGAQGVFDAFVTWCARDDSCVLRGRDVKAIWARLLARAAAGTLTDPYHPGRRVGVFDLLNVAFSSFYTPQWYTFAYYLKEATALVDARRETPRDAPAFTPVFCQDWALPVDGFAELDRRLAAARAAAPQMLVSPLALTAVVGCLGWPARPAFPQRPVRPTGTAMLLVGTRHDPATAYDWAVRVAAQLGPQARLVTYQGWGHIAYGRTDCVTGVIDAYLLSARTPAAGTSCPGVVPPPFGIG